MEYGYFYWGSMALLRNPTPPFPINHQVVSRGHLQVEAVEPCSPEILMPGPIELE